MNYVSTTMEIQSFIGNPAARFKQTNTDRMKLKEIKTNIDINNYIEEHITKDKSQAYKIAELASHLYCVGTEVGEVRERINKREEGMMLNGMSAVI